MNLIIVDRLSARFICAPSVALTFLTRPNYSRHQSLWQRCVATALPALKRRQVSFLPTASFPLVGDKKQNKKKIQFLWSYCMGDLKKVFLYFMLFGQYSFPFILYSLHMYFHVFVLSSGHSKYIFYFHFTKVVQGMKKFTIFVRFVVKIESWTQAISFPCRARGLGCDESFRPHNFWRESQPSSVLQQRDFGVWW